MWILIRSCAEGWRLFGFWYRCPVAILCISFPNLQMSCRPVKEARTGQSSFSTWRSYSSLPYLGFASELCAVVSPFDCPLTLLIIIIKIQFWASKHFRSCQEPPPAAQKLDRSGTVRSPDLAAIALPVRKRCGRHPLGYRACQKCRRPRLGTSM